MPDDLSFLDQLEEWLESQVPANLHELPYKMLETMEKVTNELFETLNIQGPSSISIPFPPFGAKEVSPPPPPPPIPTIYDRPAKLVRAHPLAVGVAVSVGLGLGGVLLYRGLGNGFFAAYGKQWRLQRQFGVRGVVEDGMLKEAIVILSPSPVPPLLVPLAATLLRAGYIVLIAVPHSRDADSLERRLSGLEEKPALRVLIYDPDDTTTFHPFHRSMLATLTLRFPASGKYPAGDPYNPSPAHIPHIHAFLSLYPMNPSPPSQPGGLPALPTLLVPNADGSIPKLINFYPAAAVLTTPETFANQVLFSNHLLLGKNLAASSWSKITSVYIGDINLPTLPAILSGGRTLTRRQQAKERLLQQSSPSAKVSIIRDYIFGSISAVYGSIIGAFGLGSAVKEYSTFESRILRVIKSSHGDRYTIGRGSLLPLIIHELALPTPFLSKVLAILPAMPAITGPGHPPLPRATSPRLREKEKVTPPSASASSSDHEGAEDLVSSIHTTSASSRGGADSDDVSGTSGLEGSWVGLEGRSERWNEVLSGEKL